MAKIEFSDSRNHKDGIKCLSTNYGTSIAIGFIGGDGKRYGVALSIESAENLILKLKKSLKIAKKERERWGV